MFFCFLRGFIGYNDKVNNVCFVNRGFQVSQFLFQGHIVLFALERGHLLGIPMGR